VGGGGVGGDSIWWDRGERGEDGLTAKVMTMEQTMQARR
jgi:hypothetical protein